jgi:methionyl-tRNA synthetase
MKNYYVTTAIPYVNAKPHVGHALEFVQADVISRYHKLLGNKTILLSGGDENALKNVQAAEKANEDVGVFVDKNSKLFEDLAKALNVKFDVFQKGSAPNHYKSSQDLWNRCSENGDIYKKTYTGLYCVGCEAFYEKNELNENGECFEHPGKKLDEVSEENYFFKLSKYENEIKRILSDENDPQYIKIVPESRKNEMISFLKQGLTDISISRSNERAKNWGVPVPNDKTQRMYVWFDALNIYRSGVEDLDAWPADVHVIGKGILRFHAIFWPAFLLSAKLPLPKSLFVHGYFTVNGQKMSKTLGNVIDPIDLINKYGTDALRYYLLSQIPSTADGDFSEEKLKTVYNADLANGLGNLVSRVAKLCETNGFQAGQTLTVWCNDAKKALDEYKFNEALQSIWVLIADTDKKINEIKPWTLKERELETVLESLVKRIQEIGFNLQPFLPETAEKILAHFSKEKITAIEPLFPRIK